MVDGAFRMATVTLRPHITLEPAADADQARVLVEKAHQRCFIGNSVSAKVDIEPVIQFAEQACRVMMSFERILCPVDFSDPSRRALNYAVALSRWYGAPLTVLHVHANAPVFEVDGAVRFAGRAAVDAEGTRRRRTAGGAETVHGTGRRHVGD